MKKVPIPESLLSEIIAQAEREYPEECCGVILGDLADPKRWTRVRAFANQQRQRHETDPAAFPKTAREAYWMDPEELLAFQKEIRKTSESIRAIYHSHIDAPAVFSKEDERMACPNGRPSYPETGYLILSVIGGRTEEINLFHWDPQQRKFTV
jgi:proteasome lid subunit RPN8/RPN11